MKNQGDIWEREYKNPLLVSKDSKPQADVIRFLKFLKKKQDFNVEGKVVLDLGAGTGRNANYLAEKGAHVIAIEISKTAIALGKSRAREVGVSVDYRVGDIGESYSIEDNSVDIILDITSSNSLSERGRDVYLKECSRVLKSSGYMFVRALAKDGNKNVKYLLKNFPGKEPDTYILSELGLTERVFSKEDILALYKKYFTVLSIEKKSGYTRMNGRVYKRDYFLLYMKGK